ncbi:MAG: acetate--CoA ligase family protein, partial [Myxococcota bacterium]
MTRTGLDAVLAPRSVAVVGVSRERGGIGAEIFHNLIASGFRGPVYPVNPHADWVQSVKAYASVAEVPGPVDLVVITTPASAVRGVVEACAAKGVNGIVVISAGFAEGGGDARAQQRELAEYCRRAGMRMVGPNCLGVLSTAPDVRLNATFGPINPPRGSVAFATQSGGPGLAAFDYAESLGVGISELVSMGNKADVSGNDLIERWRDHPATRVILLYLESFGNPRRFLELAREVSAKKPIIAVKAGRTPTGARAASSHTAALTSSDTAAAALFAQTGVVRVESMRELLETASVLALQPVPAGRRTAIITNAGGLGIMAADACEARNLLLPKPDPSTRDALRGCLPAAASVENPIDMVASASAQTYEQTLSTVLASDAFDSAIVLLVPTAVTNTEEIARSIVRASAGTSKPVVTAIVGVHGVAEGRRHLCASGFPAFAFPEDAVNALGHATDYGVWRAAHAEREAAPAPRDASSARRILDQAKARLRASAPDAASGWLDPQETHALLAACGIAMPRSAFVTTIETAIAGAERIGYPVVAKVVAPHVLHKTEVGGVRIGLRDAAAVRAACGAMVDRLNGVVDGFVIQEMREGGTELLAGVSRDPTFGPLIGFGAGGTQAELLADVAFRIAPLTPGDARALIEDIRSQALLK